MRNNKVTAKNVYTSEAMQRGGEKRKSKKKDAEKERKEEEERKKREAEKIRTVMAESPAFKKIIADEPGLSKYLDSHPNLNKTQLRDLLDERPRAQPLRDRPLARKRLCELELVGRRVSIEQRRRDAARHPEGGGEGGESPFRTLGQRLAFGHGAGNGLGG